LVEAPQLVVVNTGRLLNDPLENPVRLVAYSSGRGSGDDLALDGHQTVPLLEPNSRTLRTAVQNRPRGAPTERISCPLGTSRLTMA
jgi:hypothetical protein